MLEIPVEAAGFADVPAFGPTMWAAYLFLMAVIGVAFGTILATILLSPRKARSWAREGPRRTYGN